jgi:MFS family permease
VTTDPLKQPPSAAADAEGSRRLIGLAAPLAVVTVFAVTMGLTYPLLSLVLETRGVDGRLIGLNSAMTPLGLLLSSFLVPGWTRRFGAWPLMVTGLVGVATLLIVLGLWWNLPAWFVLRFLLGVSINLLFVLSETWINLAAPPRSRGRVLAIYATTISLGFALGPTLLILTGTASVVPFVCGAAICGVALVVLVIARPWCPSMSGTGTRRPIDLARAMSLLLGAVVALAVFDSVALTLLPVYGLRAGLDVGTAALLLSVLVLGNIALQYPIGWLADRFDTRVVLLGCAVGALVGGVLLHPALLSGFWLWPLLFLWGGVTFGLYTVALAMLGHRFSGPDLVAGNAGFAMMWGVGGVIGPPITGVAMEAFGAIGLPVALSVLWAVVVVWLVALLVRGRGSLGTGTRW